MLGRAVASMSVATNRPVIVAKQMLPRAHVSLMIVAKKAAGIAEAIKASHARRLGSRWFDQ